MDIHKRLADALRDENLKFRNGHLDGIEWCLATADILLSLPDIAIVELPEPLRRAIWPLVLAGETEAVSVVDDDEEPVCISGIGGFTITESRTLAAALLAAANKAEQYE